MPFLIEHVTEVVTAIVILVSLGSGALIFLAITRRQRREKYFQRIDELRERFRPVVAALLAGKVEYSRGLEALQSISGLDREYMLEQLCLEKVPPPAQVPTLRRLCEDLGLVKFWQKQLAGQFDVSSLRDALASPDGIFQRVGRLRFLMRARAAGDLGKIRHQPSWPLLMKALDDPHPDVQGVALRALGVLREPQTFAPLVKRLHEVILKPASRLSLRSVKTALVGFPLSFASELIPSLRHPHRRIRFLATDVIREMVEREAESDEDFSLEARIFPAELAEIFLTVLCFDENPDVRARSAPVIAYLGDARTSPTLLTMLEDPQWFVRLHAVRALAKRRYMSQAAELARRLTDPHWMVRESAARALLTYGQFGTQHLFGHFLESTDRYSKDQIADEMQRAGLIPSLLTQYAEARNGQEAQVIAQLADMGKTSYLVAVLMASHDQGLTAKFLQEFGAHANPVIREWVSFLATASRDPELRSLAKSQVPVAAKERKR